MPLSPAVLAVEHTGCIIKDDDSILMIRPEWLREILNGKTYEIRGKPCPAKIGKQIFLAASESSSVSATAVVLACHGPLSKVQWEESRKYHRVPGPRLYGECTYAWELKDVKSISPSILIKRKRGSVDWQTGPGF